MVFGNLLKFLLLSCKLASWRCFAKQKFANFLWNWSGCHSHTCGNYWPNCYSLFVCLSLSAKVVYLRDGLWKPRGLCTSTRPDRGRAARHRRTDQLWRRGSQSHGSQWAITRISNVHCGCRLGDSRRVRLNLDRLFFFCLRGEFLIFQIEPKSLGSLCALGWYHRVTYYLFCQCH